MPKLQPTRLRASRTFIQMIKSALNIRWREAGTGGRTIGWRARRACGRWAATALPSNAEQTRRHAEIDLSLVHDRRTRYRAVADSVVVWYCLHSTRWR